MKEIIKIFEGQIKGPLDPKISALDELTVNISVIIVIIDN
jgi:hypothetical protein